MAPIWKIWIAGLLVADTLAAIGLWRRKRWGAALFVLIAVAQLLVYGPLCKSCSRQRFLIYFHAVTLAIYAVLIVAERLRHRRS